MDIEKFVLEWSKKNNSFHIQELSNSLAMNQRNLISDWATDYIILMVGTKEVCQQMADNWRERLEARSIKEAA